MNSDNIEENQKIFSTRFKEILHIKKISLPQFGKMIFPNKEKSTIGYYYLNSPNVTIYNLCKISILLEIDITSFFQKQGYSFMVLNENDLEKYYGKVLINIGNNLKRLREQKSDLILDIEVLSSIDSSNLSKFENAKANLSIAILTRLADTLQTDINDLLKWKI